MNEVSVLFDGSSLDIQFSSNMSYLVKLILFKQLDNKFIGLPLSQRIRDEIYCFCNNWLNYMKMSGYIIEKNGKYILAEFTKDLTIKEYYIGYASKRIND